MNELRALTDFPAHEVLVASTVNGATSSTDKLLRFLVRYASWNGFFGSGVATLAGKIGRCRGLFSDPNEPVVALADRSVLVASYIFDAARDEFDDRATEYRDTHRDLAQATLRGLIHFSRACAPATAVSDEVLNQVLADPAWLQALSARVAQGYGAFTQDLRETIFTSIGYHLGSELLADREFSLIDTALREALPDVVAYLSEHREQVGEQDHVAYQWIAIHSGAGGAVEEDHFRLALEGVNFAFRCVPQPMHEELRRHLHYGFQNFASDHHQFFSHVNQA
ncbi:MAG: hypothetical protein ABIQ70_04100 [Dokdonella sp.]